MSVDAGVSRVNDLDGRRTGDDGFVRSAGLGHIKIASHDERPFAVYLASLFQYKRRTLSPRLFADVIEMCIEYKNYFSRFLFFEFDVSADACEG